MRCHSQLTIGLFDHKTVNRTGMAFNMNKIHPTAVIDPSARLGNNIEVGPFAVIEGDVEVGDGCSIAAHAVIKRYSKLGSGNTVHEHAVIGGLPQDLGFTECTSYVTIGNDNVIREGVTIHRASREWQATRLGNGNFLMAYCHIAHDCVLADQVIIANNAQLAGHVEVGNRAYISGLVGIHQFCRIGSLAMVGHNSKVTQDCLPFIITDGTPARARGLNLVGLKRAGVPAEERKQLKHAYKLLRRSSLKLDQALEELSDTTSPYVRELINFIRTSDRGFVHATI